MRRVLWILVTPLAALMILYWTGRLFLWPSAKTWIIQLAEEKSKSSLPFDVKIGDIQARFFHPEIEVQNIQIIPRTDKLKSILSPLQISELIARFNLFDLISGRFEVSALIIAEPQTRIDIEPLLREPSSNKELPFDLIFEQINRLPIRRLFIKNPLVQIHSEHPQINANFNQSQIIISQRAKSLDVDLDLHASGLRFNELQIPEIHLLAGADLKAQNFNISKIVLKAKDLEATANAELTQPRLLAIAPEGRIELNSSVQLEKLGNLLKTWFKIPNLAGQVDLDLNLKLKSKEDFKGTAKIKAQSLLVDHYRLGQALIEGNFNRQGLRLTEAEFNHESGNIKLTKANLSFNSNFDFSAEAQVADFQLRKLLESLGLTGVPVDLQGRGNLPCKGKAQPFFLSCGGEIEVQNLRVRSEDKSSATEIVAIHEGKIKGSVNVDSQKVQYKADLEIGDSRGSSDGEISYLDGFNINYKANSLFFKDIANLAGLKLEGQAKLEGSTEGDSHSAIFNIKTETQNLFFENYWLGQLHSLLSYKSGTLSFANIDSYLDTSRISGSIDVDLRQSQIKGSINSQDLSLKDVFKSIDRIYHLPIPFEGKGQAQIDFNGPFDFWKMNYKLKSNFKKGRILTDTYDQLHLDLHADDGTIKIDSGTLKKNAATAQLTGQIIPKRENKISQPEFDLHLKAQNYRLEESELVTKVSTRIFGIMQAQADLKGSSHDPEFKLKGSISDTILEDQEIPNSHFEIQSDQKVLSGKANIFGSKIQTDFAYPLIKNSGIPLRLRAKTTDFSFAGLLALIGASDIGTEYESNLSSDVDLVSPGGHWEKVSGQIAIRDFKLKRGQLNIQNPSPMLANLENGFISLANFRLLGSGTNIQLIGDRFRLDDLDMSVNAKIELRLFQIFLPFLEDLGGPLELSANLSGSYLKPQILGNGRIQNGFLKLKGFPHPFERISIDSVFSHSKINLPSIRASVAGGNLNGEGNILINGIYDIPTNIHATLDNVTLNVPDKVRSSGSGDITFTGRWFPFVVGGVYRTTSALVEKEFTDESGSAHIGPRRSAYLPKTLKENNFEPVILDIMVKLDRNAIVKNSLMDGSVTGQINVKGPPTNPGLLGKIDIDKGSKLTFKDKIFDVTAGQVNFHDASEINPDLYLAAQARVTDYDISLLVQGQSKAPNFTLTSIPPLAYQDIISLLALGVTSSRLDQNVQSRDQAAQTGYEIGAAILSQNISKQFKNRLGVNVQFGSTFDTTKNTNVPKITFSRPLSQNLNASMSVTRGAVNNNEFRLQYLINNNLSAVGSWESREAQEGTSIGNTENQNLSIFGLDLEFKREFK